MIFVGSVSICSPYFLSFSKWEERLFGSAFSSYWCQLSTHKIHLSFIISVKEYIITSDFMHIILAMFFYILNPRTVKKVLK